MIRHSCWAPESQRQFGWDPTPAEPRHRGCGGELGPVISGGAVNYGYQCKDCGCGLHPIADREAIEWEWEWFETPPEPPLPRLVWARRYDGTYFTTLMPADAEPAARQAFDVHPVKF